jgi:integrase
MYKIYERKGILQIRINGGKHNHNLRFSTGINVLGLKFDEDKVKCMYNSEKALNTNLVIRQVVDYLDEKAISDRSVLSMSALKKDIQKIVLPVKGPLKKGGEGQLREIIADYLEKITNGKIVNPKNMEALAPRTIANYNSVLKVYDKFILTRPDINLLQTSAHGENDIRIRSALIAKLNDHLRELKKFMEAEKMAPNTQYVYLTKVGAVIHWYEETNVLVLPFKLPAMKKKTDKVWLNPDDVKLISQNRHIRDRLEGSDRYYFDFILIGLCSTLRRIDIMKLKPGDIREINGRHYIYNRNKKKEGGNDAVTVAIIPKFLFDILQDNIRTTGRVLGDADVKHEERVSGMMRYVLDQPEFESLKREHTISVLEPDGKSVVNRTDMLYKMVTPHVLRRSAITTMIAKGVPDRIIKGYSGHTENSKSFGEYVGFVQTYFQSEGDKYISFMNGD